MGRRRNVLVQGLALSFFIVVVVMLIPSSARTQTTLSKRYGMNGDILTPGDYNGDGITDFAVFRPSNGQWFVDTNRDGATDLSRKYGTSGDIPVPGDYDGDFVTDFAVFRPLSGPWFIDTNRDGVTNRSLQYGTNRDIPIPGDYDGDLVTDIVVWRPSNGVWYISGSLTPYEDFTQTWNVTDCLNDFCLESVYDWRIVQSDSTVSVTAVFPSVVNPDQCLTASWVSFTDLQISGDTLSGTIHSDLTDNFCGYYSIGDFVVTLSPDGRQFTGTLDEWINWECDDSSRSNSTLQGKRTLTCSP